jgi:hypothetical protein
MLGYEKDDLGQMTQAVESVLTTVNANDDPWLSGNLNMTLAFLTKLLAEEDYW